VTPSPSDAGPPLGFLVASVGQETMSAFRAAVAAHDVHPRQFAVLWALSAADGQSQQGLSTALHIPASRVVALVDDLESRGLLERRAHPTDRRIRPLHLTPAGRQMVELLTRAADEHEQRMFAGLSPADQVTLRHLLLRVSFNLGVETGGHPGLRVW
jgi:DNA-binding MarR family transcriptional regulator